MRLGLEMGMRSGACLALAVALGAWASPAAADWQYTQWGMTPDQVRTASDGAAAVNTDRNFDAAGLTAGLVAPYQGETLSFTAVFLFDDQDRLRYVTLRPVGKLSCPAIVQGLVAHYGRPGGKADMIRASTMRWDDAEGDNLVVYFDLGAGDCTVQYSKLPPTRPDGKGL